MTAGLAYFCPYPEHDSSGKPFDFPDSARPGNRAQIKGFDAYAPPYADSTSPAVGEYVVSLTPAAGEKP